MVSALAVECLRACSRDFFSLLKLLRCQINWVLKMIYLLWKNWLSKIHHKTLSSVLHYELGISNSSMNIRIRYSIFDRSNICRFEYRIFHYSIPIRYSMIRSIEYLPIRSPIRYSTIRISNIESSNIFEYLGDLNNLLRIILGDS